MIKIFRIFSFYKQAEIIVLIGKPVTMRSKKIVWKKLKEDKVFRRKFVGTGCIIFSYTTLVRRSSFNVCFPFIAVVNPFLTSGLIQSYYLDEFIYGFRVF